MDTRIFLTRGGAQWSGRVESAEKESHEGGKTDTNHGFIKGRGRRVARETKKAEEGEQWRVVWRGGNERINAGEQRRGEGKNRDG